MSKFRTFQPRSSARRTQRRRMAADPRMEPVMRALKAIHSAAAPDSMDPEDLERQRKGQELLGRLIAPPLGIRYVDATLEGMACEWVRPVRDRDAGRIILYCHGGGYTSGNLGYARSMAAKLAHETRREVFTFDYRLAPEHPYPAALDDALRVWDHLLKLGRSPAHIALAGDSAGGHLALSLCHALKERGRPLPGALLLFSPWTDMTMGGRSYTERADIDPMLTPGYISAIRAVCAPGGDYASPRLSPLFGDFDAFPPTLIQVGSNEILLSDSTRLRDAMREAGVSCRLEIWRDMWHVFQMFPIRQAGRAIDHVGWFLAELE